MPHLFNPIITQVVGVPSNSLSSSKSPTKTGIVTKTSGPGLATTRASSSITLPTFSAATTQSATPTEAGKSHGLSSGSTIGLALAVPLVFIGLFVAFLVWLIRRRRNNKQNKQIAPLAVSAPTPAEPEKSHPSTDSDSPLPFSASPAFPTQQNKHTVASDPPANELGAMTHHVEADGNPQYELDSTPILISTANTGPFAPRITQTLQAPAFTYDPYRKPANEAEPATKAGESYGAWTTY